jgi:hypothetical protein
MPEVGPHAAILARIAQENGAGVAGQGAASVGGAPAWLVTGAGLGDAPGLAVGVSSPHPASAAVAAAAAPKRAASPSARRNVTAG